MSREPSAESDKDADLQQAAWERRRRRAEIFGEGLPDTTSDERDRGRAANPESESASERWLKSQVPPHHGG